ncbi:DUF3080 family protein [Marinobacterium sediminicola]|uniref:DUF3080 family protein n=1 Tax=Marinobacterium sediminicola TaxID=518898 RepID=A0ABY1RVT3_9GAMM|nr:DUF3080 family protein [Marinobacterium sediminicola]ULG70593.1 DUF3080 domain-containing protein [Marinobacterium sediminicola]SMR68917.1 Protein of unknown function [Marinobacterium sediminicola]
MRSILLLLIIVLSGCSDQVHEDKLRDYAYRVGNAIDSDYQLNFSLLPPPFPPKRERSLPVDEIHEGLLDVLDFRRCGLMELIGERNTSLGKLALPSQRLIYETRFLPRIRQCILDLEQIEDKDEDTLALLNRLNRIEESKRINYPLVISNAIFNSDEISQHFALKAKPLNQLALDNFNGLMQAFEPFQHLATLSERDDWDEPNWIQDLENSYETFYRSEFGADWLHSLLMLTQTLEQTAQAIEARLERRPICFNRKPTPQAEIIRNVFQRYYAGQLQPWMSIVDRTGQQWRSQWLKLVNQLPTTAPTAEYFVQLFGKQPESAWQTYLQARNRHTRAWQKLLGQCGMMPSVNNEG